MPWARPGVVEGAAAEKLYAAGGSPRVGKTHRFFVSGTDLIDAARKAEMICAKTGISLSYLSESAGFSEKTVPNGKPARRKPGRPRKNRMPVSERKSHGNRYTECPDCKKEVLSRTIRQHRGAHRGAAALWASRGHKVKKLDKLEKLA